MIEVGFYVLVMAAVMFAIIYGVSFFMGKQQEVSKKLATSVAHKISDPAEKELKEMDEENKAQPLPPPAAQTFVPQAPVFAPPQQAPRVSYSPPAPTQYSSPAQSNSAPSQPTNSSGDAPHLQSYSGSNL